MVTCPHSTVIRQKIIEHGPGKFKNAIFVQFLRAERTELLIKIKNNYYNYSGTSTGTE